MEIRDCCNCVYSGCIGLTVCIYCKEELTPGNIKLKNHEFKPEIYEKEVQSLQSQLEAEKAKRAKVEVQNLKYREALEEIAKSLATDLEEVPILWDTPVCPICQEFVCDVDCENLNKRKNNE